MLSLRSRERYFKGSAEFEELFAQFMEGRRTVNYDYLRRQRLGDRAPLEEKKERAYQELVDIRSSYTQRYPNRTFSASIKDNVPYDRRLESLECDDLEGYQRSGQGAGAVGGRTFQRRLYLQDPQCNPGSLPAQG